MRSLSWGLALGLLNPVAIFASPPDVVTVRINTGVCAPSGSPNGNGGGYFGDGNTYSTFVSAVDSKYGVYDFAGVYSAPDSGNLFDGRSYTSNDLSLGSCALFCLGTPYFALQYGNQCSCGSAPPSTFKSGLLICGYECSGGPTQCCGYGSSYVVYSSRSLAPYGSSGVSVYTTTNSVGSTIVVSSTYAPGASSVTVITTTNSQGSTITSTSTLSTPNQPPYGGGPSNPAGPSGGTNPPGGGTNPPYGTNPPDDGTNPPDDGTNPPDDGTNPPYGTNPPDDGTNPPAGGTNPPDDGTNPPAGGTNPPAGGTNPPDETVITTAPACPATGSNDNHTLYTDSYDITYEIRCSNDVVGANLLAVFADSFVDCLHYCSIRGDCAAVTYGDEDSTPPREDNTNCHPYSTFTGYTDAQNPILYSGVPVDGATPASFTDELCPNNLAATDNFGHNYAIACAANIGGDNQLAYQGHSLRSCLEYCQWLPGCKAVDFTGYPVDPYGGNCYPKSSIGDIDVTQTGVQYAVLT